MPLFDADLRALMTAIDRSRARVEFTPDGTVLTANPLFLDLMGYTLAELKGEHHRRFVRADERDGPAYRAFWDALRRGEGQTRTFRRLAKDGREVWIQATYNPVLGRGGRVTRVVKLATDVTEKTVQALDLDGQIAALHRSQAVIAFAPDGTILDANANFLAAVGYTLDEIRGQHHRLFVDRAEQAGEAYQSFWAALGRGEYQSAEFRRFAKGGREIWIQATYNPITDADGRVVKVVKFAVDVTAQKLQTADAAGQLTAVNRSQAVIEFAPDGTVLDANPNFLQAVGYTIEEVRGRPHAMFVEPGYARTPEYVAFWDRLRGGDFASGMFQRFGKDGRSVWIQASYNPIFDPSGRLTKIVKYATDVTANMEARAVAVAAAERTLDSVQVVTDAAETMNAAAQEISRSMTESKASVDEIHGRAGEADAATERLRAAAGAMSGVVATISSIAQQINLLALNATIEAARAGAAGRGFAVVAAEVKDLAGQAAAATGRINGEIVGMQTVSDEVAGTLASITAAIGAISGHVDGVSASTDEQARATGEILVSMRQAASGVSRISTSLDDWTVGMEERRTDKRTRVLLPAEIHLPGGGRVACSVRDLSDGGARLHVLGHAQIPERFVMTIDDERRRVTCEIRHRAGASLNVQFVQPVEGKIARAVGH
ncbi:PAS domain S-box protein [Methylobacterium sp. NEAU 140]|uniref:PAS domain-containing protein n=1 Tax=Methylobacterium sp. NEAU 140 TaxID=3064945 RepID=UPI002732F72D|nr:PAS domain-containing protein [Methylobacterium sp. NEAU 140]MDP4026304.1 PAS domain S-box protein [Methylobacterium sp. NEAU 140]MDP4026836.1 PAS domain S-box protein [Methylobacterium sp. NEAU 140]MDP4026985.1 PAS domain S-box protein [Methylobacterium sp. NEAU 140]MDP4027065.1 PAS domain S-box protein [Methylobacterium sp. NEAU 140]